MEPRVCDRAWGGHAQGAQAEGCGACTLSVASWEAGEDRTAVAESFAHFVTTETNSPSNLFFFLLNKIRVIEIIFLRIFISNSFHLIILLKTLRMLILKLHIKRIEQCGDYHRDNRAWPERI